MVKAVRLETAPPTVVAPVPELMVRAELVMPPGTRFPDRTTIPEPPEPP